jgi:hypothetical protein
MISFSPRAALLPEVEPQVPVGLRVSLQLFGDEQGPITPTGN